MTCDVAQLGLRGNWFERRSDHMNPVLIKETRQILKSRHFVITFFTMLTATWLITLMFLLRDFDRLTFGSLGSQYFCIYFRILMVPLCFVIPLIVFRSMLEEFQEQTLEMLTLSTLPPEKIARGKVLGGAVHMGIVYSVFGPFLAFTYMLDGIGLPTIIFYLILAFLISTNLSVLALALAAGTQRGTWIVAGLFALIFTAFCCYYTCFAWVSPSAVWDIGANDSGPIVEFFAVYGFLGGTVVLVCNQFAIERLKVKDDYFRPAHVFVKRDGTVKLIPGYVSREDVNKLRAEEARQPAADQVRTDSNIPTHNI